MKKNKKSSSKNHPWRRAFSAAGAKKQLYVPYGVVDALDNVDDLPIATDKQIIEEYTEIAHGTMGD